MIATLSSSSRGSLARGGGEELCPNALAEPARGRREDRTGRGRDDRRGAVPGLGGGGMPVLGEAEHDERLPAGTARAVLGAPSATEVPRKPSAPPQSESAWTSSDRREARTTASRLRSRSGCSSRRRRSRFLTNVGRTM